MENYTIAEGYELPSKGLVYDKKVNAHVELRSMTARDEMKRTGASTRPLKVLADIIEGCMIEKPAVHVYDMCFGDYEFLLHKLRIITYGPDYKIDTICPICGEITHTNFNLDDLKIKEFSIKELEEIKSFILPKCNKSITLRMLTPHILEDIDVKAKELKRSRPNMEINFETLAKLLLTIDTIDGQAVNVFELENFINKLSAYDLQMILGHIDKLNGIVGIETGITLDCHNCGNEIRTFFRIGQEFLRPVIL